MTRANILSDDIIDQLSELYHEPQMEQTQK